MVVASQTLHRTCADLYPIEFIRAGFIAEISNIQSIERPIEEPFIAGAVDHQSSAGLGRGGLRLIDAGGCAEAERIRDATTIGRPRLRPSGDHVGQVCRDANGTSVTRCSDWLHWSCSRQSTSVSTSCVSVRVPRLKAICEPCGPKVGSRRRSPCGIRIDCPVLTSYR